MINIRDISLYFHSLRNPAAGPNKEGVELLLASTLLCLCKL